MVTRGRGKIDKGLSTLKKKVGVSWRAVIVNGSFELAIHYSFDGKLIVFSFFLLYFFLLSFVFPICIMFEFLQLCKTFQNIFFYIFAFFVCLHFVHFITFVLR